MKPQRVKQENLKSADLARECVCVARLFVGWASASLSDCTVGHKSCGTLMMLELWSLQFFHIWRIISGGPLALQALAAHVLGPVVARQLRFQSTANLIMCAVHGTRWP
eukprot:1516770-Amphidinium_carterae.1